MAFARHSCGDGCHHPSAEEYAHAYSLFKKIDLINLTCLNESVSGGGVTVFKPWEERLNREKFVESDSDAELLFNIPFTGNVKLKSIIVAGDDDGSHPNKLRIFKNRVQMSFEDSSASADQELELVADTEGMIEHSVLPARFNSTTHLTLHFPSNFGAETTRIYYIGLKGDFAEGARQEVAIVNYELAANPLDHKQDNIFGVTPLIK